MTDCDGFDPALRGFFSEEHLTLAYGSRRAPVSSSRNPSAAVVDLIDFENPSPASIPLPHGQQFEVLAQHSDFGNGCDEAHRHLCSLRVPIFNGHPALGHPCAIHHQSYANPLCHGPVATNGFHRQQQLAEPRVLQDPLHPQQPFMGHVPPGENARQEPGGYRRHQQEGEVTASPTQQQDHRRRAEEANRQPSLGVSASPSTEDMAVYDPSIFVNGIGYYECVASYGINKGYLYVLPKGSYAEESFPALVTEQPELLFKVPRSAQILLIFDDLHFYGYRATLKGKNLLTIGSIGHLRNLYDAPPSSSASGNTRASPSWRGSPPV